MTACEGGAEAPPAPFVSGYRDRAGIDSRANSALLRVAAVLADVSVPSAVQLVEVARIMAGEPILTDTCPAAYTVRAEAQLLRAAAGEHQRKAAGIS